MLSGYAITPERKAEVDIAGPSAWRSRAAGRLASVDAALGLGHQVIDTISGIDSARITTSTPGTGHRGR
ncbi:hypothetical protein GCM10015535_61210 [Streptomyces gelaticus]|uniref:Uncharacterized protein n=1 Tax=Streptomyces gelaticus TaxID=285446 RepID=A0ABQ2W6X7_9ACTN|nr:hypothetical protein GCM10015535_61210 [Streptomyces gelaticus]